VGADSTKGQILRLLAARLPEKLGRVNAIIRVNTLNANIETSSKMFKLGLGSYQFGGCFR
jgi:hypothetical protein